MNTVQTLGLVGGIIGVLSFIAVLLFAVFYGAFTTAFGGTARDVDQLYTQAAIGIIASTAGLTLPFQFKRGRGLTVAMIIIGIIDLIAGSIAGILPAAIFFAASYKAKALQFEISDNLPKPKKQYCPKCGEPIMDKYCSKCGVRMELDVPEKSATKSEHFCPTCGEYLLYYDKYCSSCGTAKKSP